MSRRARFGGFTLVELLVALAVAGIVALAAQQLLATALDARARSRTQRELALSAAARRAALEAWLRGATLSVPLRMPVGRILGFLGRIAADAASGRLPWRSMLLGGLMITTGLPVVVLQTPSSPPEVTA